MYKYLESFNQFDVNVLVSEGLALCSMGTPGINQYRPNAGTPLGLSV